MKSNPTTCAIILAAGQGTRLRPYTDDKPKCLVNLAGHPLLQHQVAALRAAGIETIGVVTGYYSQKIESLGHRTFYNGDYANTNMVASAMCAEAWLRGDDDVLLCYGDIVYEPHIIRKLMNCDAQLSTTVDQSWESLWRLRQEDPLNDAETMKVDEQGRILEIGKKPGSLADIDAQYMGLIRIRADFAQRFFTIYDSLERHTSYDGKDWANMYMTTYLQLLIQHTPLTAVSVEGGWLEVDTVEDIELFNRMHLTGELAPFWKSTL